MMRKTIYIISLVSIVIVLVGAIMAGILKRSNFDGYLTGSFSFRLMIGWPEQLMLVALIIIVIYLARKIRTAQD